MNLQIRVEGLGFLTWDSGIKYRLGAEEMVTMEWVA